MQIIDEVWWDGYDAYQTYDRKDNPYDYHKEPDFYDSWDDGFVVAWWVQLTRNGIMDDVKDAWRRCLG